MTMLARPAWLQFRPLRAVDSRPGANVDVSEEQPLETFEQVYAAHYRNVHRYVLLMLGRPDDADDVVADTFQRAFVAWQDGRGPAGRPLPWLLLIARRVVTDRWRRARRISWLPIGRDRSYVEPGASDDAADKAEFWLWLAALARVLPDRQREVIYLRYQRDLTDEEIGELLGLSASGVRSLVARALTSLRAHPELWS
jgi:RNA polymerase sigma-70 factor, ECF subfamily